jgi:hypothetical protein
MYLVTSKQHSRQSERFGESFGNVHIEENGLVARHCGPKNSNVYVRGIGDYSSGIHKIRFIFKKTNTCFKTWFTVVSKLMPISQNTSDSPYTYYGWNSNDRVYPSDPGSLAHKVFRDIRGETTFEIELELDCDNRKISYVNQGTKNRRELNVDITKCPFPWQFQCYLFEIGDCVRLLS